MRDVARLSPRSASDYKCGYALLRTGDIRNIKIPSAHVIDIEVRSAESKNLRSHAEIVFSIGGNVVTAIDEPIEVIRFRKKLARLASARIINL